MKKIITILFTSLCVLLFSCEKSSNPGGGSDCVGTPSVGCTCPQVISLVCGCNGVTYDNPCLATCAGVKTFGPGRCR